MGTVRLTARVIAIINRLINACWSIFQFCLLFAVLAALVVGGYLYFWLDDEIRRQVEQRLRDHYRDLYVEVGAARFDQQHGIAIRKIRVLQPAADNEPQPLIEIDELYLVGQMRIEELVSDRLKINEIVVRRPRLHATRQPNGSWSLKSLLPFPDLSDTSPAIKIEDATLDLTVAASGSGNSSHTIQGVDLTLTPAPVDAAAKDGRKRFCIAGSAKKIPAQELRIEGDICASDGSHDLIVTVAGVEISPRWLDSLPEKLANELAPSHISGRVDATVKLTRKAADRPLQWSATFKIEQGRVAHPSLPEPFSELTASGRADSQRLLVERLACRCGSANIVLAAERVGWAETAPLAVAAKVIGVSFDEHSRSLLPSACSSIWQRFEPAGMIDAELRLIFDGRHWHPQFAVDCRDVSLTDAVRFPYRLKKTTGRITYEPTQPSRADQLRLDLIGIGAGRPVRIEAELTHLARDSFTSDAGVITKSIAAPHPLGWVTISGSDIPLHEQLVAALPPRAESLVRSLRAQGIIDFQFRAEWQSLSQPQADISQDIRLKDCAVQYDRFPYPLRQVNGLVTQREHHWTLHNVEGRGWNDATVVRCVGGMSAAAATGDFQTNLLFTAESVALDEHLKLALPAPAQQLWDELRPQGRVNVTVRAVSVAGQSQPTIEARLRPHERAVSIEPVKYPYRLEQIDGVVIYRDDQVVCQNLRARHGRTELSASAGAWKPMRDGGWQLSLAGVNVDRLSPDRELLLALPTTVQKTVERLQPSGTFALYDGSLKLRQAAAAQPITAEWDVQLDCHQAALNGELPLQSISGGVRLVGEHDGETYHTAGELAIDSFVWRDVQLTNVRGPIWIDAGDCLLGDKAAHRKAQPARRVTADIYGGSLAANLDIQLHDTPRYYLDLAVGGTNLGRLANERLGGPKDMNGTVSGRLVLSGVGQSTHSLRGAGELNVVDANIYELPVLVAMLKVLRNRTPNTTAFNRCDTEFLIDGERIRFQKLNLLGDAVSLYGKGETDLDRRLDLTFYTLPEPVNLPIPMWKTIAGQVSRQAMQLKVVGTWEKAEVQPQTLPAFSQVLEQIQAEIQGAASHTPSTAARETGSNSR